MASLPIMAERPKKRRIKRSKQPPKLVVVEGGKKLSDEDASDFLHSVSDRMRARQAERTRPRIRISGVEDRSSVRRLVEAVERQLVAALWTLARLPNGGSGGSCGIAYMHTREEVFANAVADGQWRKMHPGAPLPREIDAMHEPLSWLEVLPRELAAIVRSAANSKQGNHRSNVAWGRVRTEIPQARNMTIRSLQRRYEIGLRTIAINLAFKAPKA